MLLIRSPFVVAFAASCLALVPLVAGEVRGAAAPVRNAFSGKMTLDQAMKIALRQNPDILKQIQEIERTRGQIIEVRAEALPHLTLSGNYNQQDRNLLESGGGSLSGGTGNSQSIIVVPTDSTGGTPSEPLDESLAEIIRNLNSGSTSNRTIQNKSWQVSLEVRQALYRGGQVAAALKIARFADDAAYFQLRDTIDQVIATVRQQFANVLTSRALINVAEESVRLAQDQLKDQRNRFEAGTVPRFNVLRAEVELANVQPDLIRARNNYQISQINLAKSLGLDPGANGQPTFEAVGELRIFERPMSLQAALEIARARRPFLKVQRLQILQQTQQVKVALAGYKPSVDGNAGYEIRNSALSDRLDDTVDGWFFGFTGGWDIFDGFATAGRVRQARAALESAKINYDDSVQRVNLEVQQAYSNLDTARETVRSQQKNVEQALEALRLANERFAAGAGTQLEILDARTALTRARSTELQSRGDYNTALAEFDRATATDTIYAESFPDPLLKLERRYLKNSLSPKK